MSEAPITAAKKRKRRPNVAPARHRKDLGSLHKLFITGLPDFVNIEGNLEIKSLASALGITPTAIYAQFNKQRISPKRVSAIVRLSRAMFEQGPRSGHRPLSCDDLLTYI